MNNTLLPTSSVTMMGGGINVDFITDKALFATNNKVIINSSFLIYNKANGGVGGGLSFFYVHSPYTADSGDRIDIDGSNFINNQADYGQAFAMQSSPKYRKAIFRGATSTNSAYLNTRKGYNHGYESLHTMFKNFLVGDYNTSRQEKFLYYQGTVVYSL